MVLENIRDKQLIDHKAGIELLKIPRGQPRAGSIPALGIKTSKELR
jgi:hypothetical protein